MDPFYVLDWQTEVRLCGSDFNHLMENICGEKFTNEAESGESMYF